MAARRAAGKVKKGSVIGPWIVEEELTPAGSGPHGQSLLAVRVGRESLAGFVISNLHATTERFAIQENESGDWQVSGVGSPTWETVNGKPGRRVYRVKGFVLRTGPKVDAALLEGL